MNKSNDKTIPALT